MKEGKEECRENKIKELTHLIVKTYYKESYSEKKKESYSDQDSVILAKEQTNTSVKQGREPRNQPTWWLGR